MSSPGEPSRHPRRLVVEWVPGSDWLRGRCFCGAVASREDPIEVWAWLHGHPVGHEAGDELDREPSPLRGVAVVGR